MSSARIAETPGAAGVAAAAENTSHATRGQRSNAADRNGKLRRRCTMRTVSHSRILNPMQNLLRSIDGFQNIQVFDADHLFPQQRIADPVQQTFPVFFAD